MRVPPINRDPQGNLQKTNKRGNKTSLTKYLSGTAILITLYPNCVWFTLKLN